MNTLLAIVGVANAEPLLQDVCVVDLPGYADTHLKKSGLYHASYHHTGDHGELVGKINWLDTSAITDILLQPQRGQFAQWSQATLYGLR